MKNNRLDFDDFIKKLREKMNSFPQKWNKETRTIHLVEEVGELMEIILQYKKHKQPFKTKEDIKVALADVLEDILCLAELYEIDVENIFDEIVSDHNS